MLSGKNLESFVLNKSSGLILPYQGTLPTIHKTAFIAPTSVIIGQVEIDAQTSIWFNCVVRGDMNEIKIGKNSNIQDGTIIHVDSRTLGTYIGNRVTVGHMALLHACTLKDDCMIGMQATIMDGAVIESRSIIAAGSLVTPGKYVKSGELWAGSPAKKLRDLNDQDKDMANYIWPSYVQLSQEYIEAGHDLRKISES